MVIAVLQLDIRLFSGRSLKEKRRLLRRLISRVRQSFNVSVSEIGHQDLWQRSELGIALVTSDAKFADKVMNRILQTFQRDRGLSIISSHMELF